MKRKSLSFALQLIAVLLLVGILHYALLYARDWPILFPEMALAYLVNLALAIGIYMAMLRFAAQQSQYLGFLFLVGSALKFAAYFIILEPVFRKDSGLTKVEFFYFFIPYLVCLVAETFALLKLLRETDASSNS